MAIGVVEFGVDNLCGKVVELVGVGEKLGFETISGTCIWCFILLMALKSGTAFGHSIWEMDSGCRCYGSVKILNFARRGRGVAIGRR